MRYVYQFHHDGTKTKRPPNFRPTALPVWLYPKLNQSASRQASDFAGYYFGWCCTFYFTYPRSIPIVCRKHALPSIVFHVFCWQETGQAMTNKWCTDKSIVMSGSICRHHHHQYQRNLPFHPSRPNLRLFRQFLLHPHRPYLLFPLIRPYHLGHPCHPHLPNPHRCHQNRLLPRRSMTLRLMTEDWWQKTDEWCYWCLLWKKSVYNDIPRGLPAKAERRHAF